MSEDWSYYIDQFWDDHSNPLFNHLFPGGPWKHLVVMIAYLVFVLKLGPKMMKGREPFQMNTIIQTYNVINCSTSMDLCTSWCQQKVVLFVFNVNMWPMKKKWPYFRLVFISTYSSRYVIHKSD